MKNIVDKIFSFILVALIFAIVGLFLYLGLSMDSPMVLSFQNCAIIGTLVLILMFAIWVLNHEPK